MQSELGALKRYTRKHLRALGHTPGAAWRSYAPGWVGVACVVCGREAQIHAERNETFPDPLVTGYATQYRCEE